MKDELAVMWRDFKCGLSMVGLIATHVIGALASFIAVIGFVGYWGHGWYNATWQWAVCVVIAIIWALYWWRESARKRLNNNEDTWV